MFWLNRAPCTTSYVSYTANIPLHEQYSVSDDVDLFHITDYKGDFRGGKRMTRGDCFRDFLMIPSTTLLKIYIML